ncbi:hypothetical protein ABL78_2842 [Leptomonas seymouri]|uniref:Uncharacterized protein n=1 Tax=Leptomonas seymouri TaxID=5684 RepID=A0A0N0P6V3_LEPSE|nr:hypothetical protein ABL78_2842 [Leptomonas seymouri]|eukprot:KPI88066.1 hypothetical protein ABL78_2842 [Leptomonas seymouri]
MRGASPQEGKPDANHSTGYLVLLHHCAPYVADTSVPASASAYPHKEVVLHARLRIRQHKLCLLLSYDPSKQSHATSATKGHPYGAEERSPAKRASTLYRRKASIQPSGVKPKQRSLIVGSGRATNAATTKPSTSVDPHRHQRQHYMVELKEVCPLAAQLPLSAELRAHLRLNAIDGEAATYLSHSSPRCAGLMMHSSRAPTTTTPMNSNFYLQPRRVTPQMSHNLRQDSPSAGPSNVIAPIYGQYLSAEEPFKTHTRSLQTSRSKVGQRSGHHISSLDEGDSVMAHVSRTSSRQLEKSNSPLLRPQREFALMGQMEASANSDTCDHPSALQTPGQPTEQQDTITDYAELLLVAFFGVVASAGVPNLSFTTDPRGEVMIKRKAKKMSSRPWHKSLFKWFVPSRLGDALARRSVNVVSTISGAFSSSSGSTQVSPVQTNATRTIPGKFSQQQNKQRKGLSSTIAHRKTSSPVSAAAAHIDPQQVLELPFILASHSTFHLRFFSEEDMNGFLCCYVELQTQIKKDAGKVKNANLSSPLWHPPVRKPTFASNRVGDEGDEVNSYHDSEGAQQGFELVGTASSASYQDYPRNTEAIGPGGDAPLVGDSPTSSGCTEARRHKDAGGKATKVMPPMAFLRSRGWEEYLRYNIDPRFNVPYASFPLYLWNSFLPLSKLVLYTCYRGFLIVERVPPDTSNSDEDSSAPHVDNLSDQERAVQVGKQRLNALVNRLLTPIYTAHDLLSVPPRLNQHGVAEVHSAVPVTSVGDRADAEAGSNVAHGISSWDAVKLVLPSTEEATGPRYSDRFTTVKDIFLCLSESHLLFVNSFGRLRFQCSMDEIAMVTYSAATADFPTYPFFRFRLRSSDHFGAPIFVLTFTLLPEVPHAIREAPRDSLQEAHLPQPPSTVSLAPSTSSSTVSEGSCSSDDCIHMLETEEKERLLRRHEDFLRVFSAVCPRSMEFLTFDELLASGMSRSRGARLSRLASAPYRKASGSPLVPDGTGPTVIREMPWMSQNFNANPIPCIKVEAGDVELYDVEVAGEGRKKTRSAPSTLSHTTDTSRRQCRTVARRRAKSSAVLEPHLKNAARCVTPRWGHEDPGILLRDGGRDMDFSLEVATRTMPYLAQKKEVHASFGSHMASMRESLHLGGSGDGDRRSRRTDSNAGEEYFVPIAPKKKQSVILHRTTIGDV